MHLSQMPRRAALCAWALAACALTAIQQCSAAAADVPGVVIAHRAPSTREFIGSPSLAILPDGSYAASHDLFGPRSSGDRTVVFASGDTGQSWSQLAEIQGQWWSTLFFHQHALYLIGTSKENGFVVIRRSSDRGRTWTTPRDRDSGLLLSDAGYHCAPVPVVLHRGRIWRAMEDTMGPAGWPHHFHAFMMSASAESDLLGATNWTCSNRLGQDPEW